MPGLPCLRKLLLGRFLLVVRAGRLAEDEQRRRRPDQPEHRGGDQVGTDAVLLDEAGG